MNVRRHLARAFHQSGILVCRSRPLLPPSRTARVITRSSIPCRYYNPRRPNDHHFHEIRGLWRISPEFRIVVTFAGGCIAIWIGTNMERAPVTGRWRFVCVSEEYEAELGRVAYQETLAHYRDRILRPDDERHKMVSRVLERLLPNSGLSGDVEYHVVDDEDQMNAFVIPG